MKLIKSLIVAGSVAIALGTLQANAQSFPKLPFSVTNQFEPLNFSLTITKQVLLYTNLDGNTNVYTSTTVSQKVNTQSLLQFMASALGTNWPTGAKLALDLTSEHVCVVDKTGKNLVKDLYYPIDNETNEVYITFGKDPAVVAGKEDDSRVALNQTTLDNVWFDVGNEASNTYFWVEGNDTSVFKATATTASQTDDGIMQGDGNFGKDDVVVTGNVSGAGSWKKGAE